jgi:hypothetical protein
MKERMKVGLKKKEGNMEKRKKKNPTEHQKVVDEMGEVHSALSSVGENGHVRSYL